MNSLIKLLVKAGLLQPDLDYRLLRISMIVIFVLFGYQKWFTYEAVVLIPYISHGPLISWMYPVFGTRGASWFLGVSEWLIGTLLILGFWNKAIGALGALGSVVTFFCTVTIIPFLPAAWEASAGGFPAISADFGAFLIKDVALLAVSLYLLTEDALRVSQAGSPSFPMTVIIRTLARCGLFAKDSNYRLLRGSMVVIFLFFGYTKWWEYGAQAMVLFITHGPLIFWLYPAFGFYGAARFLGAADWCSGLLMFSGFWNKTTGIVGDLMSTVTFITTLTIIPFIPDGWAASAGGFPAMTGAIPFLVKDVVLLAVSIYLLKQDVQRALAAGKLADPRSSKSPANVSPDISSTRYGA